jgi:23S rRNA (uracil1939-C5)-methyltransferase
LQHLVYSEQTKIKKEIFVECLRRLGRINQLPPVEIVAAEEFGYRHRAQIKLDENGNAGFFARDTNDIVCVPHCPLLVGPLNNLLNDFSQRQFVLALSEKNFMVITGDNGTIASSPKIAGRTSKSVTITVGEKTFDVQGDSFFQSNRPLLQMLGTWAAPWVQGDQCIDLYGGSGFFSVMLADRFKRGLLIESVGAHVAAATENFKRNGISHFEALQGTAEEIVALAGNEPVDCLIVDPPRAGLTTKVLEGIVTLNPKLVMYVSCDAATQARDVGFLVNKAGYAIARAAIFDLYPNTHHLESILLLTKSV